MVKKKSRIVYRDPGNINDAMAMRASVLTDMAKIDAQLTDPHRRPAAHRTEQDRKEYEDWHQRAEAAKGHLQTTLGRLDDWIARYESGRGDAGEPDSVASPKKERSQSGSRSLLARARRSLLLHSAGIDPPGEFNDLITAIGVEITGNRLLPDGITPLRLARAIRGENPEVDLAIAARVADVSHEPEDILRLKDCAGSFIGSDKLGNLNALPWAVDTLLRLEEKEAALEIAESALALPGSKSIRAAAAVYGQINDAAFLDKIIRCIGEYPQDDAAINWAILFEATGNDEYWVKAMAALESCVDFRLEQDRLDGIRCSMIKFSDGKEEDARLIYRRIAGLEWKIRALCHMAEFWPNQRHVTVALEMLGEPMTCPFTYFRDLIKICVFSDCPGDVVRMCGNLADHERGCYMRSLAAALADSDDDRKRLLLLAQADVSMLLCSSATPPGAEAAIGMHAWALARHGKAEDAMRVALCVNASISRCTYLLAVHRALDGEKSPLDIGIL